MGFIQQTPPTSIPPDTALTLVAIGLPERESCSTENCTSAAKRTVNNLKIALQLQKDSEFTYARIFISIFTNKKSKDTKPVVFSNSWLILETKNTF